MFTRPSEVAFYEAAFHVSLCLPIHPTIRRILHFYNICPTQLALNAWRSIIYEVVLWRFYKCALSLNKFRNLFSLFKNPKPDSRWLYFKTRPSKTLLGGYPSNVKGWKRKSSMNGLNVTYCRPVINISLFRQVRLRAINNKLSQIIPFN